MPPLVEFEHASLGYGDVTVVQRVDLRVAAGDAVVLTGPSGGGKSTVLLAALGLLRPLNGRVARSALRPSWVPQAERLDARHPASVREVVLEGAARELRPFRRPPGEVEARAAELLEAIDLAGHGRRRFDTLSGGQRQRVLLARALVGRPDLLVLDEPTSALDERASDRVLGLLEAARSAGCALLVATHDPADFARLEPTTLGVDGGAVHPQRAEGIV